MSFSFAFQQQNKHLLRQRDQRHQRARYSNRTTITGGSAASVRTNNNVLTSAYDDLCLQDEEIEISNNHHPKFNNSKKEEEAAEIVVLRPEKPLPSSTQGSHEQVLLRDFSSSVNDATEPELNPLGHTNDALHNSAEQSTFKINQSPPTWAHPVRKSIRTVTSSNQKRRVSNTWKALKLKSLDERCRAESPAFLKQETTECSQESRDSKEEPQLLRDFTSPAEVNCPSSGVDSDLTCAPVRTGSRWLRSPPPLHSDKTKRFSEQSLFRPFSSTPATDPCAREISSTDNPTVSLEESSAPKESPFEKDTTTPPKKPLSEKKLISISSSPDGVIELFRDFHTSSKNNNVELQKIEPAAVEDDDEVTLPPPAPVALTTPPPPIDTISFTCNSSTPLRSTRSGHECDSSVASLDASDRSTSSLSNNSASQDSLTESLSSSPGTPNIREVLRRKSCPDTTYFKRYTMPSSVVPPSLFPPTAGGNKSEQEIVITPTKNVATSNNKAVLATVGAKGTNLIDLSKPVALQKNIPTLEKPILLESRQDSHGLNTSSPIRPTTTSHKNVSKIDEDDSDLSETEEDHGATTPVAGVKKSNEVLMGDSTGKKSSEGASDISSMSSNEPSSSEDSSDEDDEEEDETYSNARPTSSDGIPDLPPLKDTTVETQYIILKEMRTRLIEATTMANQYKGQYTKTLATSQSLVKKVNALEAQLASSQQQQQQNANDALSSESNNEEMGTNSLSGEGKSTTPPRSPRFSLRSLRRTIKKKDSGYAPVEEQATASPSTPSTTNSNRTLPSPSRAGGSVLSSPMSSSFTNGLVKQDSQTSVIDNMETVVASQQAKAEMVQRITELQRRNGMLAEKLQSLSNLYARAYHTITHLKQQHKIELDKQSEVELQLLNQISELADEARRKEEQYHEHLSEQSKVIENLRQKVEAVEKERQEERENPILVKLEEDYAALQSDVETLAGRNSQLNHENGEMRRELKHNQQMVIPQLEQQLRHTEVELQKMTHSLRVVCDEKALLKDTLTMSHLTKMEEMQASHVKQLEEIKEANGLVLKELQDQLRDQDSAMRSMEQTLKTQKKRLMELESTNELDVIDREVMTAGSSGSPLRSSGIAKDSDSPNDPVASANATEVQHWKENCLQLQQKVAGLEKTCGKLRQSYRERDSMCRSVIHELEAFQHRQSVMANEIGRVTEGQGIDLANSMDVSSDSQSGSSDEELGMQPNTASEVAVKNVPLESTRVERKIRGRLDSAVSIDSIVSDDLDEDTEVVKTDGGNALNEEIHDDTMHFNIPLEGRSKSMLSQMTLAGEIITQQPMEQGQEETKSSESRTKSDEAENVSSVIKGSEQQDETRGIVATSSNDDASRTTTEDEDSELWC